MDKKMRLIDADMLCNYCDNNINHSITPNEIMRMPFIDVEPVKHGHWIDDHDFAICSLCDRVIYDAYYEFRDKNDASFHNYCPYCGAKMDGGADNA